MRLAVFTKNFSNPAYAAARIGADRVAKDFGATVVHYVPETPDHPGQQGRLIGQALETRPDAFVLSPVHPTRLDDALQRIVQAGIPMVGFVNPIPVGRSVAYVGADDVQVGRALAQDLFHRLGGAGRVLVVTGPVDSVTSLDRMRGFREAAAAQPGIALVGELAGNYDKLVARQRTADWLAAHAAPDACLVANDIMALGVLQALDAAGAKAVVVGVNAIPEAVAAIAQGRMAATADFNAMQMAALATECAIRHLRGEPVPAHLDLPVQIVDGNNWRGWDQPYEARPLNSLAHYWRHA